MYDTIFLLSACNVLIVVTEGTEADLEVLDLLKRAEMLHLNVSEHPASVTTASNMDQDVDMLPYIGEEISIYNAKPDYINSFVASICTQQVRTVGV